MATDTKETYTKEEVAKIQSTYDTKIRDLNGELRTERATRQTAEQEAAEAKGKLATYDTVVADLKLEHDVAKQLEILANGTGSLARNVTDYTHKKSALELDAKPVRERVLKEYAEEIAGKSFGQLTAKELIALGDETKMDRHFAQHFDPTAVKPVTQPGQTEGEKGGMPPLPGAGGAPSSNKTEQEALDERYPTMKTKN